MDTYKAAAIQMSSQPDIDRNFEQAYQLLRQAAGEDCRLAGLPEHFAWLGDMDARNEQAGMISERAESFLSESARELDLYILGGSFPAPAGDGKVFNRSILVDPYGSVLARYDKIHLFDVVLGEEEQYRESDYVKAGAVNPSVFHSEDLGTIGLTICYDLRFPELYRALSAEGADLITVPSAFTAQTGKDHWEPLMRSRAIENTCYLFAPAQAGIHGEKRKTHGHAMIVDPWGTVLAEAGQEKGLAIAEIDAGRIDEVRNKIPSLKHRRL